MYCLHYAEKQRASNLRLQGPAPNAPRLRANQPAPTAIDRTEEFRGTRTGPAPGPAPGAPALASAGRHAVRTARSRLPAPARPRGAPYQKLENTHHKREGKRLPVRNRQLWQVLSSRERRLRPPPTQGRTSDPEDAGSLPGYRGASSRLVPRSSAPSTPQGGLELERSWGSWRSGAKGQVRVRKRIPARIPGARGSHLSSRAEALRGTQRAASAELRAHGPRLGRRPLECPESSSASWAQAAVAGARARAGVAVRSSPSPGAGRLCARGAPPAAAALDAAAAAASPSFSTATRSPPSRPARRLQLKADPAELIPEGH